MLEVSLTATIAESQVRQTLGILAGCAALQPIPIQEHRILFKPEPAPERPDVVGGTQDVQTRTGRQQQTQAPAQNNALMAHLVRPVGPGADSRIYGNFEDQDDQMARDLLDWSPERVRERLAEMEEKKRRRELVESGQVPESAVETDKRRQWKISIYDIPQAAQKKVTARTVWDTVGVEGQVGPYLDGLGYKYLNQYLIDGHYVVIQNILVRVFRLFQLPPPGDDYLDPRSELPPISQLSLFDPSGGYIVEATVRVADENRPELVAAAVQQLDRFKQQFQGVFDLVVPDRLVMDPRVRPA